MNKEVLVYVKGLQFAGDEVSEANTDEEIDKIETICPGEYFYKNDTHFVLYEEIAEGLRGYRANKHIIFYRILADGDILVIRILHQRMDLKLRLLVD